MKRARVEKRMRHDCKMNRIVRLLVESCSVLFRLSRPLSTSYRFFAGLRLSSSVVRSTKPRAVLPACTEGVGGSVSGSAVEYTSAAHASAPVER